MSDQLATAAETNEKAQAPKASAPKKKTAKKAAAPKQGAKKSPKKKASAKSSAKKAPAKKTAKGNTTERQTAKSVGLSLPQYRVLKALSRPSDVFTYREIEAKTGYYSTLTKILRKEHEGSLGSKGLVIEAQQEGANGGSVLAFRISKSGSKLLAKANS